jgi:DNA-binding response OmpR family regulator
MGTILEADSGEQAMSLAMRHRLTLVMADVAMGPMDGLDFCRALKAQAPVPVIMMTANDERTPRGKAPEAGADAYLTKPFDLLDVRRLVGEMIG